MAADWKDKLMTELGRDKKRTAILGALVLVAIVVVARMAMREVPQQAQASIKPVQTQSISITGNKAIQTARRPLTAAERTFTRDIFTPNLDFYPPAEVASNKTQVTLSAQTQPDPDELRKLAEQNIRTQAQTMELQSIVMGAKPAVVINKRLLGVGEKINEFEVIQINATSCQLQKDGVVVVLEMKT